MTNLKRSHRHDIMSVFIGDERRVMWADSLVGVGPGRVLSECGTGRYRRRSAVVSKAASVSADTRAQVSSVCCVTLRYIGRSLFGRTDKTLNPVGGRPEAPRFCVRWRRARDLIM